MARSARTRKRPNLTSAASSEPFTPSSENPDPPHAPVSTADPTPPVVKTHEDLIAYLNWSYQRSKQHEADDRSPPPSTPVSPAATIPATTPSASKPPTLTTSDRRQKRRLDNLTASAAATLAPIPAPHQPPPPGVRRSERIRTAKFENKPPQPPVMIDLGQLPAMKPRPRPTRPAPVPLPPPATSIFSFAGGDPNSIDLGLVFYRVGHPFRADGVRFSVRFRAQHNRPSPTAAGPTSDSLTLCTSNSGPSSEPTL